MVWERHWGTQRQVCALVSCSIVLTVFYSYLDLDLTPEAYQSGPGIIGLSHASDNFTFYLVSGDHCKIPNLDPFHHSLRKYIQTRPFVSCRNNLPHMVRLTHAANTSEPQLEIDKQAGRKYVKPDVTCCYEIVHRVPHTDDKIKKDKAVCFKSTAKLPNATQMVTVSCSQYFKTMKLRPKRNIVYENFFYILLLTDSVREKMKKQDEKRKTESSEAEGKVERSSPETRDRVERSIDERNKDRAGKTTNEENAEKNPKVAENQTVRDTFLKDKPGENNLPDKEINKTELDSKDPTSHVSSREMKPEAMRAASDESLVNDVQEQRSAKVAGCTGLQCDLEGPALLKVGRGKSGKASLVSDVQEQFKEPQEGKSDPNETRNRRYRREPQSDTTHKKEHRSDKRYRRESQTDTNHKRDHRSVIVDAIRSKLKDIAGTVETAPVEVQEEDLSLLIIGIDSISRLNMIRSLPKTRKFLQETGWFELEGFNKVGLNTLPNLVVMLSGTTSDHWYKTCNPGFLHHFDPCPIIWQDLNRKGYITSYGEDVTDISTFNFHKKGFQEPPTDYYWRPLLFAAESQFKKKTVDTIHKYCVGSSSEAEHLMQYTHEFVNQFSDYSYFNFVWMNAFSHDDVNTPSRMDKHVYEFLSGLNYTALNNTVVIFMSDHGVRFGPIRQTYSGWFEDRLPYIFFHFPAWYQAKYPGKIRNLRDNRNRLTTVYDVYDTLNALTRLTNRSSCNNSRSLLEPISVHRSCAEMNISKHYCTCTELINLSREDPKALRLAQYVLGIISKRLEKHKTTVKPNYHCANLTLKSIHLLQTDRNPFKEDKRAPGDQDGNMFIIRFDTDPSNALFEATVMMKKTGLELTGDVSRLNMYRGQDTCLLHGAIQLYCYCVPD
ncbi:hypothetical protein M8J77_009129 [Diaphorina citri]|nr:hypothetical protein M8J77_009129 [Diaphorina citri]